MRPARSAIEAALAANDIAHAAALAETALAAGEATPMLLNLAAWAREEAGDFAGAHRYLEQALTLSPRDPLIIAAIGSALRKQGLLADALAALDQAIAIEPMLPSAWLDRGYALEASGSIALAEHSFARSAAIDPSNTPAWGALADAAARQGRRDVAHDACERALAIDAEEPRAMMALARLSIEEGALESAIARLGTLLDQAALPPVDRFIALSLMGDAHDRAGTPEAAFDRYTQANRLFETIHAADIAAIDERQADFVARVDAEVAGISPDGFRPLAPYAGGRAAIHAFLLGFPRSGTTLVENILASLPGAAAIEEQPTLEAADEAFLAKIGGLEWLAYIDDPQPFQRAYWGRVAAAGVALEKTQLFVDMDPLKGIRLPIIARLFPGAKVIVMRRDPREVVWSCFRTAFAPSGSAIEFTSLMRTAQLYDATIRLTERCLATMEIDAHILRYDRLVEDFDATTQSLCGFLGVDWTEDMRAFDKTATARGVSTASIGQVRRGLYDGRRQWEPYAARIDEVMPVLMPWVEKFGFER